MAQMLDSQGPLNRRKALVARLMSQMSRASYSGGHAGGGVGITGSHINPAGRFAAPAMPLVPANPSLPAPAAPPPFREGPPVPAGDVQAPTEEGPGEAPAQVAPEWQSAGFISQDAMASFNGLDESSQQRILQNPVARRRFFA